jgi:hypothetical protein
MMDSTDRESAMKRAMTASRRMDWAPYLFVFLLGIPALVACGPEAVPQPHRLIAAPDDRGFRTLKFAEFAGDVNEALLRLPFTIMIPASYERAKLPGVPDDYSYWMPRDRVKAVSESGDLPSDTGYFYSKISLDVAYDPEKKLFVGFEDRDPAAEMKKAGIEGFVWERADLHGYPAIFCRFQSLKTKQAQYGAYLATLNEDIVFFVSYTSPAGDPTQGEKTWSRFRSKLSEAP